MRKLVRRFLKFVNPEFHAKQRYFQRLGHWPNFVDPHSYNEKINYRKFHGKRNSTFVTCSDKLAVRQWISERIGNDYLVPLLYSGESISKEKLSELGKGIVVKTTHDSGSVYIVGENSPPTPKDIVAGINKSLAHDFGRSVSEWWYSAIPRRVIVEKLLVSQAGAPPDDYKFHVFRRKTGIVVILQMDFDRHSEHTRSFYDEELSLLDISKKMTNTHFEWNSPPKNYEEMLHIAKRLGGEFDYARVDLYNVDGAVYFGEITFAPAGGFGRFSPDNIDIKWGELWEQSA
ncbi:Uncharacterised protein [BD1-7 clade bacterium]|nr:Uncharacterised protein [BD1-7 clade bacterium]